MNLNNKLFIANQFLFWGAIPVTFCAFWYVSFWYIGLLMVITGISLAILRHYRYRKQKQKAPQKKKCEFKGCTEVATTFVLNSMRCKKHPRVIILDDNPLSIASYFEEFGDKLK